jgi:hypothetical protein
LPSPRDTLYVVTLRAIPDGRDRLGRDGAYRLKRFLKVALRSFGLRAIKVEAVPSDDVDANPTAGNGAPRHDRHLAGTSGWVNST